GTNAHVIVEEPPVAASVESDAASPESFTLTLSAPHDTGLRELATRYVDHLGASADSFADICATANAGRTAFSKRLALVARDAGQARRLLGDWLDGGSPPGLWIGSVQPVEVAFCFG